MRAKAWWVTLAILVMASVSGCESLIERREEREARRCRELYGQHPYNQCCPPPQCGCAPGYQPGYQPNYQPSGSFAPPAYNNGCCQ